MEIAVTPVNGVGVRGEGEVGLKKTTRTQRGTRQTMKRKLPICNEWALGQLFVCKCRKTKAKQTLLMPCIDHIYICFNVKYTVAEWYLFGIDTCYVLRVQLASYLAGCWPNKRFMQLMHRNRKWLCVNYCLKANIVLCKYVIENERCLGEGARARRRQREEEGGETLSFNTIYWLINGNAIGVALSEVRGGWWVWSEGKSIDGQTKCSGWGILVETDRVDWIIHLLILILSEDMLKII